MCVCDIRSSEFIMSSSSEKVSLPLSIGCLHLSWRLLKAARQWAQELQVAEFAHVVEGRTRVIAKWVREGEDRKPARASE